MRPECERCVADERPTELRTAMMLHDLANLVSAIRMHAELLDDPTLFAEDAASIVTAATRAHALLVELRGFTSPRERRAHVATVFARVRRLVELVVGGSVSVSMSCMAPRDLAIDPDDLIDILVNAAANARDAMPDGGLLAIDASCAHVDDATREHLGLGAGAYGKIVVADNGAGMDEATRARAFDPFFTTKGKKGSGLGLASVKAKIVTGGGAVELSPGATGGTRLTLYVPVVERPSIAPCQLVR